MSNFKPFSLHVYIVLKLWYNSTWEWKQPICLTCYIVLECLKIAHTLKSVFVVCFCLLFFRTCSLSDFWILDDKTFFLPSFILTLPGLHHITRFVDFCLYSKLFYIYNYYYYYYCQKIIVHFISLHYGPKPLINCIMSC